MRCTHVRLLAWSVILVSHFSQIVDILSSIQENLANILSGFYLMKYVVYSFIISWGGGSLSLSLD